MSLFTSESSNILKDPSWLQPLSDPPNGRPLCREADLKAMANYLSELFRTGQARNLFIYGKPGTGKTICVKHLLSEVNRHASETNSPVLTAYVNAGKTRTPYYTMAEILKQLGVNVPSAGWQMFRLKQAFEHLLIEKSALIAVDEVDSIIFKEKEPLVYYLNRQPKTTLILISNKIEDATQLPERALSTFQPTLIYLEPYTPEETGRILKERVEHAFKPGAITDKLLNTIAQATSEAGDIRLGFCILLLAAASADKARKRMIETEDVQVGIENGTSLGKIKKLNQMKKQLLDLKKKYERK